MISCALVLLMLGSIIPNTVATHNGNTDLMTRGDVLLIDSLSKEIIGLDMNTLIETGDADAAILSRMMILDESGIPLRIRRQALLTTIRIYTFHMMMVHWTYMNYLMAMDIRLIGGCKSPQLLTQFPHLSTSSMNLHWDGPHQKIQSFDFLIANQVSSPIEAHNQISQTQSERKRVWMVFHSM